MDLKNGKTFVDVGTNIGQTLLDFAHIRKPGEQYLGFEANPFCAQMVGEIIATNKMSDAMVLPVGLANQSMLMQLYSGAADGSDQGATLVPDLRPAKELHSQWVACYRFDDAVSAINVPPVGLIKIDVEGAELEVLAGMDDTMRGSRPDIMCEVLHRDPAADKQQYADRLQKMQNLLKERNYAISRIVRTKDDLGVKAIEPIEQFPDKVFDPSSHFECDYLFTALAS
jgi:FkbM family methyltransferase